jgi:anaerobic magnesium-protoporphyrin IX monomethyl ester cyclase
MNAGIVLVYPYFRTHAPTELLFQPLGIASLAGQLKSLGLSVAICDCTFITFEQAIEKIAAGKPAILGISVMVTLSAHASRMARALRERLPETLFVCGGPLPTLYPDRFVREFDCVFRGESDLVFPAFCRDYLADCNRNNLPARFDQSRYPGIVYRTGSDSPGRPPIHHGRATLDTLPLPDRSGGEHARYQQFWLEKTGCKPASILLTRGCPFHCDFCSKPVFGDVFRTRSVAKIMDEIDDIKRYGYDQLWIADDCFTLDEAFVEEFCRSLLLSKADVTWTCLARPDGLTEGAIRLMRSAGCVKIYLGLESGDDATLRLMNKNTTVESGIRAVRTLHDSGIKVGGFFIVGYPGETKDSLEKTFSLALSLPLEDISFNVPFPLPGSALYARVSGLDADADWAVENETKFVYLSEFDTAWLKERIAGTLRSFHAANATLR